MNKDHLHIECWFPDDLSDETAYAVYTFLEEFTYRFEQAYYAQIRRHTEDQASPGDVDL